MLLINLLFIFYPGKCSVTLHNDAEPLTNYLARDEAFYYKLIYDPNLKTLQEDRGSMRIGSDYQSEIQCLLKSSKLLSNYIGCLLIGLFIAAFHSLIASLFS